nr:MAG TPA: hypothetical protein [Caudoviricetes sp.]
MESPHWDPTTPGVRLPACACTRLPGQTRCTERGRKTGKTERQGGQPDTPSRAGSFRPCLPRLPCQPAMPAYPACPVSRLASLPCTPTMPACLPYPISCHARMCHIVNESATRASRKTAFCQAILLFPNLSKRYALIHSNLHVH